MAKEMTERQIILQAQPERFVQHCWPDARTLSGHLRQQVRMRKSAPGQIIIHRYSNTLQHTLTSRVKLVQVAGQRIQRKLRGDFLQGRKSLLHSMHHTVESR